MILTVTFLKYPHKLCLLFCNPLTRLFNFLITYRKFVITYPYTIFMLASGYVPVYAFIPIPDPNFCFGKVYFESKFLGTFGSGY